MKRFIVIILALFMLASCAGNTLDSDMEIAVDVGGSANSYDVNTDPSASADYLIGVDDFAGSWAVQRF
ncbi:MAG TPA: lipoprotein, partial [Anaerolineales bacterium]|nr:lipoprotein [Anaerolineales bacterium]